LIDYLYEFPLPIKINRVYRGGFGAAAIVYLANLIAHHSEPAVPGELCKLPDASHALELLELQITDLPRLQQMALVEILRLGSLLTTAG
jgi:hypothetical protein